MIETLLDLLAVGLIALGLIVTGVTVFGVVRMKGLYVRLQAASKAAMLGTVAILAASIGTGDGATIARAVIVILFLLLTTPVAAHAIVQAAYRRDRRAVETEADADLPATTPLARQEQPRGHALDRRDRGRGG